MANAVMQKLIDVISRRLLLWCWRDATSTANADDENASIYMILTLIEDLKDCTLYALRRTMSLLAEFVGIV